jgi:hypothetical protein
MSCNIDEHQLYTSRECDQNVENVMNRREWQSLLLKKSEQDSQINIVVEFESRVYNIMNQMLINSLQEKIFLKC